MYACIYVQYCTKLALYVSKIRQNFFCTVESREQITTLLTDLGCTQADVSAVVQYTSKYVSNAIQFRLLKLEQHRTDAVCTILLFAFVLFFLFQYICIQQVLA